MIFFYIFLFQRQNAFRLQEIYLQMIHNYLTAHLFSVLAIAQLYLYKTFYIVRNE